MANWKKILITSDIHSHVIENIGLFNHIAAEKKNGCFIIDIGDFIEGTYFHKIFNGRPETKILSSLYNLIIPGNHGFKQTVELFEKNIACANLLFLNRQAFRKFIVIEVNNTKVCLIGIISPDAFNAIPIDERDGFSILEPLPILNEILGSFTGTTPFFVVLSHSGIEYDMSLAKSSRNINIIVNSHCHSEAQIMKVGDNLYRSDTYFDSGKYINNFVEVSKKANDIEL